MNDFKVLLIHANTTLDTMIPPNLAIMNSFLKQENIKVKLFDTTFYKTRKSIGDEARVNALQVKETNFEDLGIYLNKTDMYEDFMEVVKEYKPNLIGLSSVSVTYPFGIKFFKLLREKGIDIPTVVGGIHATVDSESILKEDCVDYVCVGEGEQALVDLCVALKNGKDTTNIQNIWTKSSEGIKKNPCRLPLDIQCLPFQDWDIFDERRIHKPMGGKIKRTGCFELTRGCPFSCTFCCNEFLNKLYDFKYYREKSIGKFIEEVRLMKEKHNLEYIYVSAESFMATKKERFEEFCSEWKNKINLPFWIQTRPEHVTLEKAKKLEDAGCVLVNIGLESGDPGMREKLNRKMDDETIINAIHILKTTSLRVCVNAIIGFPDETREQIFNTINLSRKLNADSIMAHIFNPYHGTTLHDLCIKKNYISLGTLGQDYRSDSILNMPDLSADEIKGLQRTFLLYVKLPEERWPEIKIAEKFDEEGNKKFEELKEEYTGKFLN